MAQLNQQPTVNELEMNPDLHEKPETLTQIFIRKFVKNKLAVIGAITLMIIIILAILAPVIAPYSPSDQDLMNKLAPPSADHWLGTDRYGRDIFTRLIIWWTYIVTRWFWLCCRCAHHWNDHWRFSRILWWDS